MESNSKGRIIASLIFDCGCVEYLHEKHGPHVTTRDPGVSGPGNSPVKIMNRQCLNHELEDIETGNGHEKSDSELSIDSKFLGGKLDKLIQICEMNTAELKSVIAQVQVNSARSSVNTSEDELDANDINNATPSHDISGSSLSPAFPNKDILRLVTSHIVQGLESLHADVNSQKGYMYRHIKLTLNRWDVSSACREELERLQEPRWKAFDHFVNLDFEEARKDIVKAVEQSLSPYIPNSFERQSQT